MTTMFCYKLQIYGKSALLLEFSKDCCSNNGELISFCKTHFGSPHYGRGPWFILNADCHNHIKHDVWRSRGVIIYQNNLSNKIWMLLNLMFNVVCINDKITVYKHII